MTSTAWVLVDLQVGLLTGALAELAQRTADAVQNIGGDVWAVVQQNPKTGPLTVLRGWTGCAGAGDDALLEPLAAVVSAVATKTGYGTATSLDLGQLRTYRRVLVCGADTDACVLGVALGLFDAGVPVEVVTDLCLSAAGPQAHQAGLVVLRRQLGAARMTTVPELMGARRRP